MWMVRTSKTLLTLCSAVRIAQFIWTRFIFAVLSLRNMYAGMELFSMSKKSLVLIFAQVPDVLETAVHMVRGDGELTAHRLCLIRSEHCCVRTACFSTAGQSGRIPPRCHSRSLAFWWAFLGGTRGLQPSSSWGGVAHCKSHEQAKLFTSSQPPLPVLGSRSHSQDGLTHMSVS